LDRTTAVNYLTEEFAELATDAKFTSQQTTNAYSTAIDNSLRKLGFAETDLPTAVVVQADTQKFLKLLEFFSLKRFSRLLSLRFDVEAGNKAISATRSQAFSHVERLVDEARAELAVLGVIVGGGSFFEMGRVELDFNEPKTLAEF
jgi:hypothetical protein